MKNKKFLLTIAMIMSLVMAVSCGDDSNKTTDPNNPTPPPTGQDNAFSDKVTVEKLNTFIQQLKTPNGTANKIDVASKEETSKFVHIDLTGISLATQGINNFENSQSIQLKDGKGASSDNLTSTTKSIQPSKIVAAFKNALNDSSTGFASSTGLATNLELDKANDSVTVLIDSTDNNKRKATVTIKVKEKNTKATGTIKIKINIPSNGTIGAATEVKFAE